MEEQALTLTELLDQAAAASRLGQREEAERLYRRATERSPANTQAWLGLAGAVESLAEKRACFETVLSINPNNGEARAALQRLGVAVPATPSKDDTAATAAAVAAGAAVKQRPAAPSSSPLDDGHSHQPEPAGETLYCINHPDVETTLRCNRCGRPVCVRCVELTDVGYRCKECIRQQQDVYFNALSRDYVIVALVSFALAAVAAPVIELLLGILGLFFGIILAVVLGPAVGGTAATIIRRSVGRRRGRYMGLIAIVAIILGMIVGIIMAALFGVPIRLNLLSLIPLGVFLALALSTIYATLR